MKFGNSASRYGVTRQRVQEVLRSDYSEAFDEGLDKTGYYRVMYMGFDSQGVLLEVGVKFMDSTDFIYVFHANKATPYYQQLFNERKRK